MLLAAVLPAVSWHLQHVARLGVWDVRCDRIDTRLGRFGLGRN